jgi:signal peptidase I
VLARLLIAALVLALANGVVFAVRATWLYPVRIGSESMQPALERGDRLLVNRRVEIDDLRRGDIVVVALTATGEGNRPVSGDDQSDDRLIVKRVIGLPGERIQGAEQVIAAGRTTRLREPWANWGPDDSSFGPVEIAEDEVYVLGDSRARSDDSRDFGAVPEVALRGRAVHRVWPVGRWGEP